MFLIVIFFYLVQTFYEKVYLYLASVLINVLYYLHIVRYFLSVDLILLSIFKKITYNNVSYNILENMFYYYNL